MAETAEQETADESAHQQPADHAAPARTLRSGRGLHRRGPGRRRARGHLAWRGTRRGRVAPAAATAARAPATSSGKRIRRPEERDEHHYSEHGHSRSTSHGDLLLVPTGGDRPVDHDALDAIIAHPRTVWGPRNFPCQALSKRPNPARAWTGGNPWIGDLREPGSEGAPEGRRP